MTYRRHAIRLGSGSGRCIHLEIQILAKHRTLKSAGHIARYDLFFVIAPSGKLDAINDNVKPYFAFDGVSRQNLRNRIRKLYFPYFAHFVLLSIYRGDKTCQKKQKTEKIYKICGARTFFSLW